MALSTHRPADLSFAFAPPSTGMVANPANKMENPRGAGARGLISFVDLAQTQSCSALAMSSVIFFASPSTITVLSR